MAMTVIALASPPAQSAAADAAAQPRVQRIIEGWTVHISERLLAEEPKATEHALELTAQMLQEIVREVPAPAVARLKEVPLWFSPPYGEKRPGAEYHPNVNWLREHERDPAMAKGVEFTNVRIFDAEKRRMPNFVLHELSHAYHDRVLSFNEPRVIAAFAKARASGGYDKVERQDSEGRKRLDRAYALTNHKEYFAECSEAFFSRNDFFPYDSAELEKHDPEMFALLKTLWAHPPDPEAKR